MISTDSRMTDIEDVAVLFYAMCKYGEQNEDFESWPASFAGMLRRAERAAEVIAERHKDEGDDWDDSLWFERLEDIADDSLAAQLFMQESDEMVSLVVIDWLRTI